MKKTAYGKPTLVSKNGQITPINKIEAISEVAIQELIFKTPDCLPISDIEESYNPLIPVCMEMKTLVGPLDIFMLSPDGELCIIETKLWRNPEARRKVIAQILDYAKELSSWSYEDLQREVNRKLNTKGNYLYELATKFNRDLTPNESDFVDTVSRNLKRGKFLLLIVGDGIKENAISISDFLTNYANLNFTLAMIQLNVFEHKDIGQLIIPQTIVKTVEISRIMIDIPEGLTISDGSFDNLPTTKKNNSVSSDNQRYYEFWEIFINNLTFDYSTQMTPRISKKPNLFVYLDSSKKTWVSAYFSKSTKKIGVYFRVSNDQQGADILDGLSIYKDDIISELKQNIISSELTCQWENGDIDIAIRKTMDDFFDDRNQEEIGNFFRTNLNHFVNVFKPRVRKIMQS